MPFAVVAIGDLLFAVLCLAIAMSIITFGKFIAQLIPDVPIIGSAIREGVVKATEAAGRWLIGAAHNSWLRFAHIVTDVVWLAKHLVAAEVSVMAHLGDQVSHIWSNLNSAAAALQGNLDHVVSVTIPNAVRNTYDAVEGDLARAELSLQHNIDRVVTATIPDAVSHAVTTVEGDILHLASSLQGNIDRLSVDVTTALSGVWSILVPLQVAVNATIPASIATTAANAASETRAAQAAEQANLRSATTALQADLSTARSELQASIVASSAAAAALSAADLATAEGRSAAEAAQATITAETQAQSQLHDAVIQLGGSIDRNSQRIDTLEATQAITLPGLPDVSIPQTIGIPVAVGALAAALAGVITEVDTCMVSKCGGPNSLENELRHLSGLFTAVGELGFLAQAIHDPVGTEAVLRGTITGAFDLGHAAIEELLAI